VWRHTVEITEHHQAVLVRPFGPAAPVRRRQLVKLVPGEVIRGEVCSYVKDLAWNCFVEVADIILPGGGILLRVPCHAFRFLDN
jgi:hypothetical protein